MLAALNHLRQNAHLCVLVVDFVRLVPRHPQGQTVQGLFAFLFWMLITLCSALLSGCMKKRS